VLQEGDNTGRCQDVPTTYESVPALESTLMPDLVDAIRKEIDARLEELRPLAREASDLQRALDALNGMPMAPTADGGGRRRQSGQGAAPRRSP
jgi:hypothetical protein